MEEQLTLNQLVEGSSPSGVTQQWKIKELRKLHQKTGESAATVVMRHHLIHKINSWVRIPPDLQQFPGQKEYEPVSG